MTAAPAINFNVPADLRDRLRSLRLRAGIVGGIAAIGLVIGAVLQPGQFFEAYLWSYVFYLLIAVGALAWLMTQYLTAGAWGVVIRRPCEAAARTLPLLALLFIPLVFGNHSLYSWTHPDIVRADEVLAHKRAYLNLPFFYIRAAAYFAGWYLFAWRLNVWSAREDRAGAAAPHNRMARLSGPGLVFWGFATSFMAIDWIQSVSPHWYSTMFGMMFMAGQGLSALSFLIVLMALLARFRPMSEVLTARHMHDLGKLLLANVMVWAYFWFSQFLIIWAGNLPHEIPWYLKRMRGGWEFVAIGLVLFHFAVPFALLLSRDLKRDFRMLSWIAAFVFVMRYVDMFWNVAPDFHKGVFGVGWMDFVAPIALGGIWLAYFLFQLERRPLMPLHDINLRETLEHGRE